MSFRYVRVAKGLLFLVLSTLIVYANSKVIDLSYTWDDLFAVKGSFPYNLDIAFIVDNTGSMSNEVNIVKNRFFQLSHKFNPWH